MYSQIKQSVFSTPSCVKRGAWSLSTFSEIVSDRSVIDFFSDVQSYMPVRTNTFNLPELLFLRFKVDDPK
jgi:hypothetical protein